MVNTNWPEVLELARRMPLSLERRTEYSIPAPRRSVVVRKSDRDYPFPRPVDHAAGGLAEPVRDDDHIIPENGTIIS